MCFASFSLRHMLASSNSWTRNSHCTMQDIITTFIHSKNLNVNLKVNFKSSQQLQNCQVWLEIYHTYMIYKWEQTYTHQVNFFSKQKLHKTQLAFPPCLSDTFLAAYCSLLIRLCFTLVHFHSCTKLPNIINIAKNHNNTKLQVKSGTTVPDSGRSPRRQEAPQLLQEHSPTSEQMASTQ